MDEQLTYKVVVNDEEQYSIWPSDWKNPAGWKDEGMSGSRSDCLAHIEYHPEVLGSDCGTLSGLVILILLQSSLKIYIHK